MSSVLRLVTLEVMPGPHERRSDLRYWAWRELLPGVVLREREDPDHLVLQGPGAETVESLDPVEPVELRVAVREALGRGGVRLIARTVRGRASALPSIGADSSMVGHQIVRPEGLEVIGSARNGVQRFG
jgi:hypothetical protein